MSNSTESKYLVETPTLAIEETPREVFTEAHDKYLLVNLIARRARDLNRGEHAQVDLDESHGPVDLVVGEILNDKLKLVHKPKNKVLVSLIKNE
ncbi:MAG: DNA-directed RNA polymerase subunit omega [bacterium]|nr:DNA-directed RNA polymerase subunit omega [bacterium]